MNSIIDNKVEDNLNKIQKNTSFKTNYKSISLRHLSRDDIELLREWRNDPINCIFLKKIGIISKEQQLRWFQNYKDNDDQLVLSIDEVDQLNCMIGSLAIYNFDGKEAEFGKIMIGNKSAHGKNLGYYATCAALSICFCSLGLESVILHVSPQNISALKTFLKAGFKDINHVTYASGWLEKTMRIERNEFIRNFYKQFIL